MQYPVNVIGELSLIFLSILFICLIYNFKAYYFNNRTALCSQEINLCCGLTNYILQFTSLGVSTVTHAWKFYG